MLLLLSRLLLVRMVGCKVNLSGFYSYRLIGKLTAFMQLRSSVSAIKLGVIVLPLSPRGFLLFAEIEVWQHPRQGVSFACEPELRWGSYRL